ncbi:F-box/kelch-repeat protein skip25 [Phtheirospermum japonicum]|uniref:F-box/kelch-repeat protein skip25 n=1 Tax=Phtheirospermum japonicum TaxID=374723 RepID=A0A830DBM6_9LAMI|nr:F-box/kelch-repeat protein skip25 [Phtheirospermum japonicum]
MPQAWLFKKSQLHNPQIQIHPPFPLNDQSNFPSSSIFGHQLHRRGAESPPPQAPQDGGGGPPPPISTPRTPRRHSPPLPLPGPAGDSLLPFAAHGRRLIYSPSFPLFSLYTPSFHPPLRLKTTSPITWKSAHSIRSRASGRSSHRRPPTLRRGSSSATAPLFPAKSRFNPSPFRGASSSSPPPTTNSCRRCPSRSSSTRCPANGATVPDYPRRGAVGWRGKLCMVNVKGDAAKDGILYDVRSDRWEEMPAGMLAGWKGPAAAMAEETIYAVDETKGLLRKYDHLRDAWVAVADDSMLIGRSRWRRPAGGFASCVPMALELWSWMWRRRRRRKCVWWMLRRGSKLWGFMYCLGWPGNKLLLLLLYFWL